MPENTQSRVASFKRALASNLASNEFGEANLPRMNRKLAEEGLWYPGKSCGVVLDGERIFNRGLSTKGVGSKRSNYFVFVREEDEGRKLTVYYLNPDSSEKAPMRERTWTNGKKGPVKPGQEYLIRKVYTGVENPEQFADSVMRDILYYASLKPETEYRMESHFHCGSMPPGYVGNLEFKDDGVSRFDHAIRTLALYGRDVVSVTSHNSFDVRKFYAMRRIAEELGIIMVPGTELTAPVLTPNGPHICLWSVTEGAAEAATRIAFKGRLDYKMQPLNNGPSIFEVVPKLFEELVQKGKLMMGVAHPMNFYTASHPLFSTGLISCIEEARDGIIIEDMVHLFKYFGATEAWNSTLSSKKAPVFKKTHVKEYAEETVRKNLPGVALTPNSFALAFSMELAKSGICTNSFFGTDDHYTPQMNYVSDGLNQAEGHTVLDMSRVYATFSSKPTADQIIWWLLGNEVSMRAHVYTEKKSGFIQVPWGRQEKNAYTQRIMKKMGEKGDEAYEKAVLADVAMLLATGHGDQVKNLERTYNEIPWWNP